MDPTVLRVGNGTKRLRIVHISDTHGIHHDLGPSLPKGDVLIHSGDFSHHKIERDFEAAIRDMNRFFEEAPHSVKIFVAGNHEMSFPGHTYEEIRSRLTSCVFLQDNSVTIDGVKVYGSPWTHSHNMSYSASREQLAELWQQIPSDTDVLVTHLPPFNIHDLAYYDVYRDDPAVECRHCKHTHVGFRHWGCAELRSQVLTRVRPLVHCFGHVHGCNGVTMHDGVMFMNGATVEIPRPHVVDLYHD